MKIKKKTPKYPTIQSFLDASSERAKNGAKVRPNYYSIYFTENDPNNASEVEVMEHENCIGLTEECTKELGNHYATKREANKVRKEIIKTLRLLKD